MPRRRRLRARAGAVALVLTAGGAAPALAQARPATLEGRVDLLAGDATSVHGGAGVTWPVSRFVQLGVVAAGGLTHGLPAAVADDGRAPSGRAELVARFVVDPDGGRGRRWYGGAGAGAFFVQGAHGQARVHVVAGVESRPRGGVRVAAEVGVGGGTRVGVAVRRVRVPAP